MDIPEEIIANILMNSDMTAKKSAMTVNKTFNSAVEYESVWESVVFATQPDISVFEKYGKYMKSVVINIHVDDLVEILQNGYLDEVTLLDITLLESYHIPPTFAEALNGLTKLKKLFVFFGNISVETNIDIHMPQIEEVSFIEEDFNSPMVNITFRAPVYKYLRRIETIVDSTNVPYAPNAVYLNLETCYNGYTGYNLKDMDIKYLSVGIDFSFSQYSELYHALSLAKNIEHLHIVLYGEDISVFKKFGDAKLVTFLFSTSSRNITISYDVIEDIQSEFETSGHDEAFASILNVPMDKIERIKDIRKSDEVVLSLINLV